MHHTTEDDLIWPELLDRAGLDAPLVRRMEEQHQQIDVSVADVRAATSAWRSDPTSAQSSALADRIGESSSSLKHISTRRSRSSSR